MVFAYLPITDIPKYHKLLPNLLHARVAKLFTSLLVRCERVLGTSLYWQLPTQYAEYASKPETLRVLRIITRLLNEGYLTASHLLQSNHPDEPPAYISLLSIGEDDETGWNGKSVHLFNRAETFWPALGEAIERLASCHPYYPKKVIVQNSYKELKKPKVDIFNLAGLNDEQRSKRYDVYELQYDADTIFSWIPTTELTTNTTVYAPLQWFSFGYVTEKLLIHNQRDEVEPMITAPITTGAAAGQTKDDAIWTGLLEVIERDAFIIYWLNQIPAKRIDLESIANSEIQKLLEIAADYRLELHVLYLETDVPVHTIGLVQIDRTDTGPAVMVTAKTGFDIEAMICDVLHDTLGQHFYARNLLENHQLSEDDLQPDRLNHTARMLYWYDSKHLPGIEPFISGPRVSLSELPEYTFATNTRARLDTLLNWFAKKEYQVLYRELLSPKLKQLTEGLSVAMVKVPQMQPVYLEEPLRSTKGDRLREVPIHLGYPAPADSPDPFHREPHPFP